MALESKKILKEYSSEELKKKLEVLFVKLNEITDNNTCVAELKTLGDSPHFDECKQYIQDGGNVYVSTCLGAALDVAEYISVQGVQNIGILKYGYVPDTHTYYFVCKV